jgi:hypothetical protein
MLADTTLEDATRLHRFWSTPSNLFTYLGSDNSLIGWQACEHAQVGKSHFFAAYNGDGIGITQTHWDPTSGNFVIAHPTLAGVGGGSGQDGVRFYVSMLRPGIPSVSFVLDGPIGMTPR